MSQSLGLRTFRPLLRQTGAFALRRPQYRESTNVRIQKVKFVRRWLTWKRVGTYLLYTGAAYITLNHGLDYILGALEGEEEKEWKQAPKQTNAQKAAVLKAMDRKRRPDGEHEKGAAGIGRDVTKEESEDEEEDEDEDEEGEYDEDGIEDSIFIPMTWAKEQPREYYKGSDPEWREFMKFARDGKRQTGAREQLVSRVRTEVSRHPLLKRTLGQIDDRWNNYWIHFYYPPGPPPQYERSGIEVIFLEDDDVVIAWSTRAVELKDQRRLETFLYPTGAMNAFYIIGSSLTKKYWMQFKGVFGNKPPPDASMSTLDQGLQELKRIDGRIAGSGDAPAEQSPGQSPGQPAGKSPGQPPGALVPPNVDGPSIPRQQAVPLFSTFARHFVEGTRAPRSEAPRGTVVLRGTVEVVGNKSVVISQVIGVYDPKQNNLRSVNIKIQDIRPRSLRPRGGP